jgi:hypothetical protein
MHPLGRFVIYRTVPWCRGANVTWRSEAQKTGVGWPRKNAQVRDGQNAEEIGQTGDRPGVAEADRPGSGASPPFPARDRRGFRRADAPALHPLARGASCPCAGSKSTWPKFFGCFIFRNMDQVQGFSGRAWLWHQAVLCGPSRLWLAPLRSERPERPGWLLASTER